MEVVPVIGTVAPENRSVDSPIVTLPTVGASRPSASFFDNNNTQINNISIAAPQNNIIHSGLRNIIDKSYKNILLTLAIIFALTGSYAAFFYGYYIPNQPASVVKKSIVQLLNQSGARNFETKSTSFYNDEKVQDITIKTSINDQGDIRSDILQVLAKNSINNSLIIKTNEKELYLRINQPETLLASYGITLKPSTLSAIDKVSNNWLKIDTTSLTKNNVGPSSKYNDIKLCTDSFIDFASLGANSDHNFASSISEYQNKYQKGISENVGTVKTTVFNSKYDDADAIKVNQNLYQDYRYRVDAINYVCSEPTTSNLIADPSNIKTDGNKLYINSSDQIVKAETVMLQGSAKNIVTNLFKGDVLDSGVPASVVSIESLAINAQDYSWLVNVIRAFVRMYII